MTSRSLTALGVLVVVGLAIAVPAVAVAEFGSSAVQETPADNESELGVAVTSFAQSSAVDAQGSAEQGLWQARANATFEQNATENETEQLITDRATQLEQRLRALQNRSDRLQAQRANLSEAAYNARASALRSQIANVRSAIDQANRTAVDRGVNTTQLDRLRNNAANLTGPEVAAIARNITDAPRGPPADVPGQNRSDRPRGPPADRGPQTSGNDTAGPSTPGAGAGNNTARPVNPGAGNDTAGPANPGPKNSTAGAAPSETGSGNGSDAGPPDAGDRGSDDAGPQNGADDSDEGDDSNGSDGPPADRGR